MQDGLVPPYDKFYRLRYETVEMSWMGACIVELQLIMSSVRGS